MAATVHKLNFGARKPKQRTRTPLIEENRGRRGVKLVTLFNMLDIQKDYGSCTMVYDGRKIRKLIHGTDVSEWLTREERKRFVIDIINAAKMNNKIREYMKENPFPFMKRRR